MLTNLAVAGEIFQAKILRGNVPGAAPIYVHGYNPDVDNTLEDLMTQGGTYVFPPDAGEAMRVVSTSADDAAGGIGARTVDVHYLDANGVQKTEVVTLNGLTPVPLAAPSIRRVNFFHSETVGSNGVPVGTVQLQNTAGTVLYSQLIPGLNYAMQAVYTVPANKRGFLARWNIGVGHQSGNRMLEAYLRTTSTVEGVRLPGVFLIKDLIVQIDSAIDMSMDFPIIVPPLTDIKLSVRSDSAVANAIAGGGFHGWIEPIA